MAVDGLGMLLALVRQHPGVTRSELLEQLGWSRVTLERRLNELTESGFVVAISQRGSTGGRPPEGFQLNADHGVLLAADIGSSRARFAVTDFLGTPLLSVSRAFDIELGPTKALDIVRHQFRSLLTQAGFEPAAVLGIGIGIPGPVDFAAGRIIHPPTMPGWHGVEPAAAFETDYPGAPVAVDNNANVLALGEYRTTWRDRSDLLLIKLGQGLSSGLVLDGRIYRGPGGMAGEFGHLYCPEGTQCRCGRFGCLESVAGGWAIQQQLQSVGNNVQSSDDVVGLAMRGNYLALELLTRAGEFIGEALAPAVCLMNPSTLVLAGDLARAGEVIAVPMRAAIKARTPEYLFERLTIVPARSGSDAGVIGAAFLAQDAACARHELTGRTDRRADRDPS
ncbi:MAG TPA: ROK family transcriptional regulator [Lacisediminihabitans sp.]|uniref:ROK family transcriptional regulator n=1 Tax=Lacisediminihabitans sp. TaxID=2787631 RepID=UPI002ED7BE9E